MPGRGVMAGAFRGRDEIFPLPGQAPQGDGRHVRLRAGRRAREPRARRRVLLARGTRRAAARSSSTRCSCSRSRTVRDPGARSERPGRRSRSSGRRERLPRLRRRAPRGARGRARRHRAGAAARLRVRRADRASRCARGRRAPGSTTEVQVAPRAIASGVPFVARGAGTGLRGATPTAGGVVVSLARMNRILEIDLREPARYRRAHRRRDARGRGERLLLRPTPSQQVCTIGGNVAENSGGAHCLKHGFTAHHVTGSRSSSRTGRSRSSAARRSTLRKGPTSSGSSSGPRARLGSRRGSRPYRARPRDRAHAARGVRRDRRRRGRRLRHRRCGDPFRDGDDATG